MDDPYQFGAIAAANALSDIFAMGGEAVLALNICAFPAGFPPEVVIAILVGGADKVAEAGAAIAGGHTIDDDEPKYGLSVVGIVHPERVFTKTGARPGDVLILTKPLGVGVITTAFKNEAADEGHMAGAVTSMLRLNRGAARALQTGGCRACTDVTGFGFAGHALEIAHKSGVALRVHLDRVPLLDGALRYADEDYFPGGACRNEDYYGSRVSFTDDIPSTRRALLFSPETSGGLLAAVPSSRASAVVEAFERTGETCWMIGDVVEGDGLHVAG